MGGAFLLALVLTFITYLVMRKVIINPLNRLVVRIQKIAEGDLTQPAQNNGRNEIGVLSSNVDHMQHSLASTVLTVREGAVSIYQGSTEIASGNTDLSSRTEQQAAALEQTAAWYRHLHEKTANRVKPRWRSGLLRFWGTGPRRAQSPGAAPTCQAALNTRRFACCRR